MNIKEFIDQIKDDIRNLRDADFHKCPADCFKETYNAEEECTCENFDLVNDKLEQLKERIMKNTDVKLKYNLVVWLKDL